MTRFIRTVVFCTIALALAVQSPAAEKEKKKPKPAVEKPAAEAKKTDAQPKKKPAQKKEKPKPEKKPKADEEKKPAPSAKKPAPPAAKPAPSGPPTHTVKAEPFRVEVSLDGTFVSQKMTEIVVKPDTWSTFKIEEAVEHGETVSRGDVLVKFDPKAIDEAVADGKTSQRLSEISLKQAEANLKMLKATTPMDVAMAERAKKMADEDRTRYFKIEREMYKKSAEFGLKRAQQYHENNLEELKQLEKMYAADDLTEETEEIVLKRQRAAVEQSKFYLEQAKLRCEETLQIRMPRSEESMKYSDQLLGLATQKAKLSLPLALEQQQLELEKLKVKRERSTEKFKKLLADQKLMTIKAPIDGVVYYGKCVSGKWTTGATAASKLKPGKAISANDPFITIVSTRPMVVRATVPEKDLQWIKSGLKGAARPVAYPDLRVPVTISKINGIPAANGKFAATLEVSLDADAEGLMPGMTCKVKLAPYQKTRTLTVPLSALKTDEIDDTKHYVQLVGDDGKPKKQPVEVGKRTAAKAEILDGLVAGDKVLKEYPKDQ
jgi:HlyD family secretion protein